MLWPKIWFLKILNSCFTQGLGDFYHSITEKILETVPILVPGFRIQILTLNIYFSFTSVLNFYWCTLKREQNWSVKLSAASHSNTLVYFCSYVKDRRPGETSSSSGHQHTLVSRCQNKWRHHLMNNLLILIYASFL